MTERDLPTPSHHDPAFPKEPAEDELLFRRIHTGTPALLFDTMTMPEHLCHFWGPEGTTTPKDRIVVDLQPGGAFVTPMVSDDSGEEYLMKAVYVEIDRPTKLVWEEPDSGMRTTVTFHDLGDGRTEVVTHQTHVPAPYRSPEAQAGFLTSLDRFERYLAAIARKA